MKSVFRLFFFCLILCCSVCLAQPETSTTIGKFGSLAKDESSYLNKAAPVMAMVMVDLPESATLLLLGGGLAALGFGLRLKNKHHKK